MLHRGLGLISHLRYSRPAPAHLSIAAGSLAAPIALASLMPTISPVTPLDSPRTPGGLKRPPRKLALLIGIEYNPRRGHSKPTWGKLKLPHDDVKELQTMLVNELDFDRANVTVMLDSSDHPVLLQPTRCNIVRELYRLVQGAQAGDKLFLCYSGHGKQIPTSNPNEEDGQDEYIVPRDWAHWGYISDDLLHKILIKDLPAGVKLFAVFDACTCGTILDLQHNWRMKMCKTHGPITFPPPSPMERIADIVRQASWSAPSEVLCFSAAIDGVRAWELKSKKSKPYSFLRLFMETIRSDSEVSVQDAFEGIAKQLRWKQEPQFSSNNRFLEVDIPLATFF